MANALIQTGAGPEVWICMNTPHNGKKHKPNLGKPKKWQTVNPTFQTSVILTPKKHKGWRKFGSLDLMIFIYYIIIIYTPITPAYKPFFLQSNFPRGRKFGWKSGSLDLTAATLRRGVALPEHLAGEESLADEAADKPGQSRQYHASDGATHCDAQVPPAPQARREIPYLRILRIEIKRA